MTQISNLIEKEFHGSVEWAMCMQLPGSDRYEILGYSWPYYVNIKGTEFYMIRVKIINHTMYIADPLEVIKMYTLIQPRKKLIKNDSEEI